MLKDGLNTLAYRDVEISLTKSCLLTHYCIGKTRWLVLVQAYIYNLSFMTTAEGRYKRPLRSWDNGNSPAAGTTFQCMYI
jgi:hypothetical protein